MTLRANGALWSAVRGDTDVFFQTGADCMRVDLSALRVETAGRRVARIYGFMH